MKKWILTKAQILHVVAGAVFVPTSAAVSGWLANNFPGLPHFTAQQISNGEYVVAAGAVGLAIHYLHGWQLWERTVGKVVDVEDSPSKGQVTGV